MENVDTSLIFDFNNLFIRNVFGCKEITEDIENIQWNLLYYNVFNSIYSTIWKFKNVKEVILAVDDNKSWRKSVYPRYKESRKKKRESSKVDWSELYSMLNELASELKHYMPFKVLKVNLAEADDIIGVLTKYFQNQCVIISRDEDYFQCFKNKNVEIYDPLTQKLYTSKDIPDVKKFLLKLIFCGQNKDNIPNILTPDDWGFTETTKDKRTPGFGKKTFEKIQDNIKDFLNEGYTNKLYGKVDLYKNLKRNRSLIDFDKIPKSIENNILKLYNKSHDLPPIENIYTWFEKYEMRAFKERIHEIENKLRELY